MSIGETIKSIRKSRGETQEQLADALGLSRNIIAYWESGTRKPRAKSINAIEKHYKLSDGLLAKEAGYKAAVFKSGIPVFTKRFRKLVDRYGSQSDVSKDLCVSRQCISLWYNGRRIPSIEYIVKLAKLFDVPADYLLGLVD